MVPRQQQLNCSKQATFCFGVPQGSVPGPVFFILLSKPLPNVTEHHSIFRPSYADDTPLLDSYHPDHLDTTVQRIQIRTAFFKSNFGWIALR